MSPDFSVVETSTPAGWVGRTLKELNVRKSFGINVAGIKEGDEVDITPDPDRPLREGMILMLIGANEALEKI